MLYGLRAVRSDLRKDRAQQRKAFWAQYCDVLRVMAVQPPLVGLAESAGR